MLDTKDTETVREWLAGALSAGEAKGKSAADLARACGVTPQAVNGWKKTGRIKKSHLARAAEFFGGGPNFTTALTAAHSISHWPFKRLSFSRFDQLPIEERNKIESHALFIVDEWERAEREQTLLNARPPRRTSAQVLLFPKNDREMS